MHITDLKYVLSNMPKSDILRLGKKYNVSIYKTVGGYRKKKDIINALVGEDIGQKKVQHIPKNRIHKSELKYVLHNMPTSDIVRLYNKFKESIGSKYIKRRELVGGAEESKGDEESKGAEESKGDDPASNHDCLWVRHCYSCSNYYNLDDSELLWNGKLSKDDYYTLYSDSLNHYKVRGTIEYDNIDLKLEVEGTTPSDQAAGASDVASMYIHIFEFSLGKNIHGLCRRKELRRWLRMCGKRGDGSGRRISSYLTD